MSGISPAELGIVAVIGLVCFGPYLVPRFGRMIGESGRALGKTQEEIRRVHEEMEIKEEREDV